jgi:hypothetical protein
MTELKTCPFCGGEAKFWRKGTGRVSCIVICTDCGCSLETGETFGSGQSWNTRAQPCTEWLNEFIEALYLSGKCDADIKDWVKDYLNNPAPPKQS